MSGSMIVQMRLGKMSNFDAKWGKRKDEIYCESGGWLVGNSSK